MLRTPGSSGKDDTNGGKGQRLDSLAPKYAPDLSPIEKAFSKLKQFLKRQKSLNLGSRESTTCDNHAEPARRFP